MFLSDDDTRAILLMHYMGLLPIILPVPEDIYLLKISAETGTFPRDLNDENIIVKKIQQKKSERLNSIKMNKNKSNNDEFYSERNESILSYGCAVVMVMKLLEKSQKHVDISNGEYKKIVINDDFSCENDMNDNRNHDDHTNHNDNNSTINNNNHNDNYNDENGETSDNLYIDNILAALNSTNNLNLNIDYFGNAYNDNNVDSNNGNKNVIFSEDNKNKNHSNDNNLDDGNNDLIDKISNVFYHNKHLYKLFKDLNDSDNYKEENKILCLAALTTKGYAFMDIRMQKVYKPTTISEQILSIDLKMCNKDVKKVVHVQKGILDFQLIIKEMLNKNSHNSDINHTNNHDINDINNSNDNNHNSNNKNVRGDDKDNDNYRGPHHHGISRLQLALAMRSSGIYISIFI